MNLGEKLKQLRRLRGVTQKELAGNFLTRNMLSQIERGVAMPSYATIALLSKKLRVDPSYFFESSFSLEHYEILSALPQIKRCFSEGQYSLCLRLAEPFREIDSVSSFGFFLRLPTIWGWIISITTILKAHFFILTVPSITDGCAVWGALMPVRLSFIRAL